MQPEMPSAGVAGVPGPAEAQAAVDFELLKKRVEEQLGELRWTRLLLKSLALVSLIYIMVVGVRWIGGFISDQVSVIVSKIFA
jgi:hypothetical protein